jgi:hypothetical protein
MKFFKKSLKLSLFLSVAFLVSFSLASAFSIDSTNRTARLFSDTANLVNFKPSFMDGNKPVAAQLDMNQSQLTGYAWGNNIGWVNLNSLNCDANGDGLTDTTNFSFCTTGQPISPFKVSMSGNTLSGYAWSQNGGWINFGPFSNSATPQVTMNASGQLSGFAWIQNYGWLQFDCSQTNACVQINLSVGGGGGSGTPPASPSSPSAMNGVCGSSNNQSYSSAPVDLCSIGTPTAVSGSGPWSWSCSGSNGGASASCQASFSAVAPPAPTTCQDSTAFNLGGPLPCVFILMPPGAGCVGQNCMNNFNPNPQVDCSKHPSDPSCKLTPPNTGCIGNQCSNPQIDCSANPTDPSCQLAPPSSGCVGSSCKISGTPAGIIPPDGPMGPISTGLAAIGGFFRAVLGSVLSPQTIGQITSVVNNPIVSAASKTVAAAGLVLGASASILAALFVSPVAAPELVMIPFRLWTLLLSFLGIRKQVKKWGLVYDSITMQPLDPAYVVLKDMKGNEVATSLTDIDGRYGFPVEPGTYRLMANKTDYQFPSAKLAGKDHDTLHKDLYFGTDIVIKTAGEVITKNIPMDRLNFNWNEWAKNQKNLMKFYSKRNKFWAEVSSFFFGIGFTVATVALIFAPQGYNIGIFALYVLLFILRNTNLLKAKKTGSVSDASGNPVSFAILRVYPAAIPDVEITHRVADKFGRFYCLVPNGNYIVKIDEKTGEDSYRTVFTSAPIKVSKGLIESDFKVKP